MEQFDYLNSDLIEWANSTDDLTLDGTLEGTHLAYVLTVVRDQYLPEFEAAIWKLAAANARA